MGEGETKPERERREFKKWDQMAHRRTDGLGVVFAGFCAACLFVIDNTVAAIAFGVLTFLCAGLPRRDLLARLPFGSGVAAKKPTKQMRSPSVGTQAGETKQPLSAEDALDALEPTFEQPHSSEPHSSAESPPPE